MTNEEDKFTRRALRAYVSHPNTPESDQMAEVEHDVAVVVDGDGTIETVRFYAACPVAALDAISAMNDTAFSQLERVQTV